MGQPPDRQLEIYKALKQHELELNKATAAFEHAILQPLFLLNGAAATAFMTLLGVWKGPFEKVLFFAACAIGAWCLGLLGAAAAAAFAYRSQREFSIWARLEREAKERELGGSTHRDAQGISDALDKAKRLQNRAGGAWVFMECSPKFCSPRGA